MKKCPKCQREKVLADFSKDRSANDGLRAHCKECASEYYRKYYEQNREQVTEYSRQYREINREQVTERSRDYFEINPHKCWEGNYRRRAKKFGFTPVVESFTRAELIAKYGDGCHHDGCDGAFEELDHWPIAVKDAGPHTLKNCVPSCPACNSQSWREEVAA